MALFKGRKGSTSPLLGTTLAQMLKAKEDPSLADIEKGPEGVEALPTETDPDILEAQRAARRKAKGRRGLSSTIMTGSLGDDGYGGGTVLG
jgi:hypothetical protein